LSCDIYLIGIFFGYLKEIFLQIVFSTLQSYTQHTNFCKLKFDNKLR